MTGSGPCPQCGGPAGARGCQERFEALLALDHGRREPWGPRHGLAVAVYTLQHPDGVPAERLEICWLIAYRCAVLGDDPARLARGIRSSRPARAADFGAVPRPPYPTAPVYEITIHDMGDFDAATYARRLVAWARATLLGWGLDPPAGP